MPTFDYTDYLYNPYTGNELEKLGSMARRDKQTGQKVYANPAPTASALVTDGDGKLLLVKRLREPNKGMWDLPGGFIDIGESIEQTVVRELKEELNLSVGDLAYFRSAAAQYEYDGVNYQALDIVFTAEPKSSLSEAEAQDDAAEYKFVKFDEIDYDEISTDVMRYFISEFSKAKTN